MWDDFGWCVNLPDTEWERINSQCSSMKECKQAIVNYLISSHPAPSWGVVAYALYWMATFGRESDSCHRALADLQQLFPTGIYMYFVCLEYLYSMQSVIGLNLAQGSSFISLKIIVLGELHCVALSV